MNRRVQLHCFLILAIILVKVFQTNSSSIIRISSWLPDFGMISVFMITHYIHRRYGMIYGFLYGFLYDLSLSVLGISSLAKTLSAYIAGFFEFNPNYNHTTFVTGLFLSSLLNNIISFGILSYGVQNFFDVFFGFIIPNTIYTLLIGTLLYFMFESWLRKLNEIREQF